MTDELKCKDLTQYQSLASKTAIYPGRGTITGLSYVTFGLPDEAYEFYEALGNQDACVKEIGDSFWYFAQTLHEINATTEEIERQAEELKVQFYTTHMMDAVMQIIGPACKICGIVKKILRDDNQELTEDKRLKIKFHLSSMLCGLYNCCKMAGVKPAYVMTKNIEKLYSRMERGKLGGSGNDR